MGNTSSQHGEGQRLGADTRGITTVEYAIVGALVAIVSIGAWRSLGSVVAAKADGATAALTAGTGGAGGSGGVTEQGSWGGDGALTSRADDGMRIRPSTKRPPPDPGKDLRFTNPAPVLSGQ